MSNKEWSKYTANKKFMNSFVCRGYDPCGAIISTGHYQKTHVYKSPNKFCVRGYVPYVAIGSIRTIYVCELKKPIELYQSTTYFAVILISLQICTNVMEGADHVYVTKSMV